MNDTPTTSENQPTPVRVKPVVGCDRRIGSSGVWRKVREGFDADGSKVIIAQLEGDLDETDFGKTEWQNMPKAANDQAET